MVISPYNNIMNNKNRNVDKYLNYYFELKS